MSDSFLHYAALRKQKGIFSYGLKRRSETVEGFLQKTSLPNQAKILDVGTADGEMIRRLMTVFPHYDFTGIERIPEMVELAQTNGINVFLGEAAALPFPDESFDAVTMISTIKHILHYQQVFAECHRVLKSQGILIVAEPTRLALWVGLRKGHFDPHSLPNRWSLAQMEAHLTSAGFQTWMKKRYMLAPFNFPGCSALESLLAACRCSCFFLHQAIMVRKKQDEIPGTT